VRFLIDNALSPLVAQGLRGAGHDAVHIRDRNMQAAEDPLVLDLAATENRVLVSADTDFGTLLANLPAIADSLDSGCIAVIDNERLRVRTLPLVERDPKPVQD